MEMNGNERKESEIIYPEYSEWKTDQKL
jgi:hypothetical protein